MGDGSGLLRGRWVAAGAVCAALGGLGAALGVSPKEGVHVEKGRTAVTVYDGTIPLLVYRYGDVTYKPYVAKWYSPASTNVLRDAPHDHLHHHALMLAVTADGVDFWVERKTSGRQMHRAFGPVTAVQRGGASQAAFTEMLDWLGPDAKPILTERRTIVVYRAKTLKASLLTWQSRLAPAAGRASVKLTGAHYHGLGMRFVTSMDKVGKFLNPAGKPGKVVRGTERLTRAKWCAYTAPVEGKAVTVAMFDHPDNPRPALWFTMTHPFAYLSATMNLWKQPLTLQAKQPLTLRYGAALWDGKVQPEQIEEMYKQWLDWSSPQTREKRKPQ
jgi:hypothetical protein